MTKDLPGFWWNSCGILPSGTFRGLVWTGNIGMQFDWVGNLVTLTRKLTWKASRKSSPRWVNVTCDRGYLHALLSQYQFPTFDSTIYDVYIHIIFIFHLELTLLNSTGWYNSSFQPTFIPLETEVNNFELIISLVCIYIIVLITWDWRCNWLVMCVFVVHFTCWLHSFGYVNCFRL